MRWINGVAPKSPDLTAINFLLWVHVKDRIYLPPMPATLNELKNRIRCAVESVSIQVQHDLWIELEYRFDAYRVTTGAHTEHL
jgi:hypothetical protein